MAAFELILLLAIAVLLSSVLEQVVPRVSLPLIQVALGVVIAVLAVNPIEVNLNPDFFLLIFIAPLLFNEAKESDKLGLWRNRGFILSLAIGLVIAITLSVGFFVHALIPSVPLAAAFALGAALGPTDAVAVSSLSNVAKLDRKERALLGGEALLNDASGVVSFQFAVAAAVTGSFSAYEAGTTFAIEFVGGIVLGLVIGALAHFTQKTMNEHGLDSNTFHVLFDITLPFMIYLFSEVVHVSGILAVVAAGLAISMYNDRIIGPHASRLNIVSSNVWSVLSFTLNGIVFVMLGMQLPRAMQTTWDSVSIDNLTLIGYVLGITAILVIVRFVWILVADFISRDPDTGNRRSEGRGALRTALVSTIGGPKGAVTLSVIFSTPYLISSGLPFPQRNLLIFLASGVILCTLLLANFLLPLLAPSPKEESEADQAERAQAQVNILRNVMIRLAEERTKDNARAVGSVLRSYKDRIERIQNHADLEQESTIKLRIDVIEHQQEYLMELLEEGQIDEVEGYNYVRRLSQLQGHLEHRNDSRRRFIRALQHTSIVWRVFRRSIRHWREKLGGGQTIAAANEVQMIADEEAIRYLQGIMEDEGAYPQEVVAEVMIAFQNALRALRSSRPEVTALTRIGDKRPAIERMAYNFELEEIRYAAGRNEIDRSTAKSMRDNVYLMLVDLEGVD